MTLASDAWFGRSVDVTTGSTYSFGLPWGPGGARLHVIRPTAPIFAVLPIALDSFLRVGADTFRVINGGAHSITILGILGSPIATVAPNESCELHLAVNGIEGIWQARIRPGTATFGTTLSDRAPLNLRLTTQTNVNLRSYARGAGAIADVPYAVTCTIAAGQVIGSATTATAAFDTGIWPAGTTIKLIIESGARITGIGGAGGRGGMISPGVFNEAGFPGGPGITAHNNLVVVNYGKIQGGGGGGGGGTYVNFPGCGGGGGAGYVASAGGLGGISPINGSQFALGNGGAGSIDLGGAGGSAGGSNSGGAGGGPGASGSPGSSLGTALTPAAGGAAGAAIRRLSSVTVTKLVTGTINGAEVTF